MVVGGRARRAIRQAAAAPTAEIDSHKDGGLNVRQPFRHMICEYTFR